MLPEGEIFAANNFAVAVHYDALAFGMETR